MYVRFYYIICTYIALVFGRKIKAIIKQTKIKHKVQNQTMVYNLVQDINVINIVFTLTITYMCLQKLYV